MENRMISSCEELLNAADFSNAKYFSEEIRPGVFLIGLDMGGEGVNGRAIVPGHATSNSYLIVGATRALLIDSMGAISGFRKFAEDLAGLPVMFALSHGHFDHIMRLDEFDEFWIHREDEALLKGAYGMPVYEKIPDGIRYLKQGDLIDLGERVVEVHNIKGHTDGSLLFLDRKTGTLISGDTIARRLLYGLCGWVGLDEFVRSLMELKELKFDGILSAHDRILLPKSHINYMIRAIKKADTQERRIRLLGADFIQVVMGNEESAQFQDITIPAAYTDRVLGSVGKILTDAGEEEKINETRL